MKLFLLLINLAILAFLPITAYSVLNFIAVIALGASIYMETE